MFNRSNLIILGTLLLTMFAIFGMTRLSVYHDLEAFFPSSDTDLDFYDQHRERFSSDDDFILLALVRQDGIFDSTFLHKADAIAKACDTLPYIINVASLTELKDVQYTSFGAVPFPILHIDQPEKYATDSLRIFQDQRLLNKFISEDGTVFNIILTHESHIKDAALLEMNAAFEALILPYRAEFEEVRVGGRAGTVALIIDSIESEFIFYAGLATLLSLLVMTILLQRFWGIALALVSIVISLCWFMGFLGAVGHRLDLMSPLFPTLLMVVGMSDVIHITSKYLDEINKGNSPKKSLKIAIHEIGLATFLTSLTTAIGFLSLSTSNIVAIKSFGFYAAIGVLMTYIVVIFFTTAVMSKLRPNQIGNLDSHRQYWNKAMNWCFLAVSKYRKQIAVFSIFILGMSLYGISQLSTNTFMLDDLPRDNQVRDDFLFFEEKLSGVRVFEVAVTGQEDHKVTDFEVLKEIEKFENYILTIPEVGTLYSPLTIFKSLHQSNNGNLFEYYKLPDNEKLLNKYKRQLKKVSRQNPLFGTLMTADQKYARINGNMQDLGSDKAAVLNQTITDWIAQNINSDLVEVRLTGTASLVDKNHVYLRKSLFSGLGLAFLIVSIIMAILFKSPKMVFISLVPNIFPLLVTAAVMGFVGITLKASTSIIFAIAFGIAVDDTIHFLSKFKLQLNKGDTIDAAIRTTFLEAGKAICLTTLILVAGFLTLASSDFQATYYVGLLVSVTLVTALLADFLLLPICIWWLMDDK